MPAPWISRFEKKPGRWVLFPPTSLEFLASIFGQDLPRSGIPRHFSITFVAAGMWRRCARISATRCFCT
jgi:hypothetical protein